MLRMLQGEVGIARLVKYMSARPNEGIDDSNTTKSPDRFGNKYFDPQSHLTLITEENEKMNGFVPSKESQLSSETFNWCVIRKLSLLVLLELFEGCPQNLNVFTQMYGATYGNIDSEENFLDYESSPQNQGILLLNPDALQS